jgi:hypothetical protein
MKLRERPPNVSVATFGIFDSARLKNEAGVCF